MSEIEPLTRLQIAELFATEFPVSDDREAPNTITHDEFDEFCWRHNIYLKKSVPVQRQRDDIRQRINAATRAKHFRKVTGIESYQLTVRTKGFDCLILPNAQAAERGFRTLPDEVHVFLQGKTTRLNQLERTIDIGSTPIETQMRLTAYRRSLNHASPLIQTLLKQIADEGLAIEREISAQRRML